MKNETYVKDGFSTVVLHMDGLDGSLGGLEYRAPWCQPIGTFSAQQKSFSTQLSFASLLQFVFDLKVSNDSFQQLKSSDSLYKTFSDDRQH